MNDNTYILFDSPPSEFYENNELAELAYTPGQFQFALNNPKQNRRCSIKSQLPLERLKIDFLQLLAILEGAFLSQ